MDSTVPGYCACGCGGRTAILDHTVLSQGYKKGDYRRWLKGHSNTARDYGTLEERFTRKIDRSGGPDACWEWLAGRVAFGYGRFTRGGEHIYAHRMAYELWVGPVPPDLHVLHDCDNPRCCNPRHLHLGTTADNMRERSERGRGPTGERSGSKTHPECVVRGERHSSARLRERDVLTIRELVSLGKSQQSLARRYGVSGYAIWAIVHRKSWTHLP